VKGVVDGIGPFPEIEVVETIVVQTDDSWLGGGTPLVVTTIEGI
jgi:hypothetical protein